jgi:hypothetical protein
MTEQQREHARNNGLWNGTICPLIEFTVYAVFIYFFVVALLAAIGD